MSKETIAWECPHCKRRHLWRWELGDAVAGQIRMWCDNCGNNTWTRLFKIGSRAWAAMWAGKLSEEQT